MAGGAGRLARAVPGGDGAPEAAAMGAGLCAGPDRSGRAQERAAHGGAARPERPRPAASLRHQPDVGRCAPAPAPGREGRRACRWAGRGAGHRRHRAAQAGQALRRGCAPVLRLPGQAGQLPGPGLAHPGPERGAGADRAAIVPARAVGGRCRTLCRGRGTGRSIDGFRRKPRSRWPRSIVCWPPAPGSAAWSRTPATG